MKLFNIDSPLMRGLAYISDLILLNVLTILCSIPLFTMGAAVTALYDTLGRMSRDEGSGVFMTFFRAFKSNFKQSTAIWIILTVLGLLLGWGFWFYNQVEFSGSQILMYIDIFLLIVWIMVLSWVYPLQCRFENTVKNTFRNALLCSMGYLPRSVCMSVLNLFPWVLLYYFTDLFAVSGIFWFMGGFSVIAALNTQVIKKPFNKFAGIEEEPKNGKSEEA